jgi:thymidylate synthase
MVTVGFQEAWLEVVRRLMVSQWELYNLIVHIKDPSCLDQAFHEKVENLAKTRGALGPKQVAYTIFPHRLYEKRGNAASLFTAYNRPGGLYERIKTKWGTYFGRMTNYRGESGEVNQLERVISAVRTRGHHCKAAYTVIIQMPGGETTLPRGGPCLNYIAVQVAPGEIGQSFALGLLAVYRNHDFLERAYGNYWGLCNLLRFLAREVGARNGPLTCVSSHAYVSGEKTALKRFVGEGRCNPIVARSN